jgi:hypothetical protein
MPETPALPTAEALIARNHALLTEAAAARQASQRLTLRTEIARIDYCLRFATPLEWRLAMAKWALGRGAGRRFGASAQGARLDITPQVRLASSLG